MVEMHIITQMHVASPLLNILLFCKFQKSLENFIHCHEKLQIRYRHIWKDGGVWIVQNLLGEFAISSACLSEIKADREATLHAQRCENKNRETS